MNKQPHLMPPGHAAAFNPSGFHMPAEWEPHQATWMAWPHNADDWPGKFGPIPWVYAEIIRHLHRVEPVRILVDAEAMQQQAASQLQQAGVDSSRIDFYRFPTDRVWTRDYGPIFVKNASGQVAITNWHFNAWAKYDNWQKDDIIPDQIAKALGMPQCQPVWANGRLVLEGGSIEVNGQGLLLTTEECLLSNVQARNPGLSRADLEAAFAAYLGIRRVLWLKRGIAGDDTHGHVDDLARFVDATTVVAVVEEDRGDANYEPLRENLDLLRGMTDPEGQPLRVVTVPMPAPVVFQGQRLPASYANFYIANRQVLVPTFNDEKDRVALNTLAALFPNRGVVGIHCVDLVWGLGALHCMTQQQPAAGPGR